MKKILLALLVLVSLNSFAVGEGIHYTCYSETPMMRDIEFSVYSNDRFLINGVDEAAIEHMFGNYIDGFKQLDGFFGSIGDEAEYHQVSLFINKELVETNRFGQLRYKISLGNKTIISTVYHCSKEKPYKTFDL